jgi:radical SAM protein with 4Fe4S-binding SPASM domain
MIRPRSRSKFLSRITLEEDVNIFSCATNLLPLFDFVHWQIVNKPKFSSPSMFADHYGNEVRQLFEYWCTELEKGHVLGIIPFQSLVNSLLFPEQMDRRSFRCKSGTELQVIDMRGNIYECDEYVGDLSKSIGNIESGAVHDLVYESHESLFAACKECSVTHICLGRCRKCLKYYSKEQIINYCLLTKSLLTVILEQMDRIKTIVSQQKMTSEVLYNKPYYNFEEIP